MRSRYIPTHVQVRICVMSTCISGQRRRLRRSGCVDVVTPVRRQLVSHRDSGDETPWLSRVVLTPVRSRYMHTQVQERICVYIYIYIYTPICTCISGPAAEAAAQRVRPRKPIDLHTHIRVRSTYMYKHVQWVHVRGRQGPLLPGRAGVVRLAVCAP